MSSRARCSGSALAGLAIGLAGACATTAREAPEVAFVDGSRFELSGLESRALAQFVARRPSDADWQRLLRVRVAGTTDDVPAMLGRYEAGGGFVRFTPRFAPEPGMSYRVIADLGALSGGPRLERVISVPARAGGPRCAVRRVYPTSDVLPENLLRFYVQFTGPMAQGVAYDHVRLLDQDRRVVELAFLEIAEELWDSTGTRLTLLIDPGRIKTGLRPRLEAGPVLVASRKYTLRIDASWPDAEGRPMTRGYEKAFSVAAPDTSQPDPKRWKLVPARKGTRDALEVVFPDPLDHGCLRSMVDVVDDAGRVVDGEIEVSDHERRLRFVPARPWAAGVHALVVDTDLEDPSGNSIRAPFEVDLVSKTTRRIADETRQLRFVIE